MQRKNKYIAAIVTSLTGIGIISWYMLVKYRHDQYRVLGGAIVMLFEILVMLIAGLVLLYIPKFKSIGQGILIGMGITLVIGFGICSGV
jgi:hypothetical protein